MKKLRTSGTRWQRDMAVQLSGASERREETQLPRGGWLSWWIGLRPGQRSAFAAAVAMLAIAAVWLASKSVLAPNAEQLLAQAYTEHRTLEVRIPGAKFAPLKVERSTSESHLDMPTSLLKAEAVIREHLNENPDDPVWLEARARADLPEGNFESAIKSLERARESLPNSPQMLTDLGSAYFLRAESEQRPIDYGKAIEAFGRALAKSPDDPIALFNRALASERMFLYTQAVDDWEHYLRVEQHGEWADEARKHLTAIREKLQGHSGLQAEPLLSASEIAHSDINEQALEAKIENRIDEYLHVALSDWLPRAYPVSELGKSPNAYRSALAHLARITIAKHRDTWLQDLISHSSSSYFSRASSALARSITRSDTGDFEGAQSLAIEAERAFSLANNPAGMMRARYQRLYVLHLSQQGPSCLRVAAGLRGPTGDLQYGWLRIQFRLDEGTCDWLVGNLGQARLNYRLALHDAESSGYPSVYLRALNHVAGIDSALGDESLSWSETTKGLARYWSSNVPPMQAYNLYFALHEVADWTRQPYLEVAVWRQAVATIDGNSDVVLRAAAHSYLGNAAEIANMSDLAEREFQEASRIFAAAPRSASTEVAYIEAETRLADLEVLHGQVSRAYDRVRILQPQISKLSDNLVASIFYRALGEVQFQSGANDDAEAALRAALVLADASLNSLGREDAREKWNQEMSRTVHTLVRLKLREGKAQDALEIWEWYQGSALSMRKLQSFASSSPSLNDRTTLTPIHELARQLPLETRDTFVSYIVFRDGVQVWAYDNRGISSTWIALPVDQLRDLVFHFEKLCSDPRSDVRLLRRDARKIYDLLIVPIEGSISSGRTLMIEADDPVRHIPFEALLSPSGQYLAEKFVLASSLGFYYNETLRPVSELSKESSALLVSVPPQTPVLNDATDEVNDIAAKFESPVVLQGKDASANTILRNFSGTHIFHFAGHAVASAGRAGILLSDGIFDATSVRMADLSGLKLVVLSACNTESGPGDAPFDPDSLARAFLRAGTPQIVVSRWSVNSAASRLFMRSFYGAALSGHTIAASVQESAAALRARPETSHPYYWSAFYALGRSGT
jgi:CHAT domain-containing protein/cytochrome c-type biogenesis protein CcmH/NrfG